MPRIVLLSDTHNCHDEIAVPDGDVLIHAGDATNRGTVEEVAAFAGWFNGLPHKHKIFVAGNHDWLFEDATAETVKYFLPDAFYLLDSPVEINGLKFYGAPWQPWFFDWAFQFRNPVELAAKWALIPADTDVLITHGPPHGILDENPSGWNCGCPDLRETVLRIQPKAHIFGHIHYSYGTAERFGVRFFNASVCDEDYSPVNSPLVFDL